jgi:hypothetical protein
LVDLKNVGPAQELQATLWRKASNFLGALAHFWWLFFFFPPTLFDINISVSIF